MKLRTIVGCVLSAVSIPAHAQFAQYAGIWQDVNNSSRYYSVQVNGDKMVLIDLPGLEASEKTLRSSFHGGIALSSGDIPQARLNVLAEYPGLSKAVSIIFNTDRPEASVSWGCPPNFEDCAQFVQRIRKIF